MLRKKIIGIINNKNIKIIALTLLALILLVFFMQVCRKANRVGGYDFTSFVLSSQALLHGNNPYKTESPFAYIYPMFFCFLLIPVAILPYWLANLLWFCLNIAFLFFSIKIILEMIQEYVSFNFGGFPIVPLTAFFLLLLNIIQNNLLNGQVNLLVLFLCVLFVKYLFKEKELLASVFLSAAISIKIVPAVFLVFLAVRRKYTSLVLTIAFTFVFCLFIPYVFLGNGFLQIFREYFNGFIIGSLVNTKYATDMFFNIKDFIFYLSPGFKSSIIIRIIPLIAVFVPLIILEIFNIRKGNKYTDVLIFNIYLLSILLYSPLSETHHLTLLIPAVCVSGLVIIFRERYFKPQLILPYFSFFLCIIFAKIIKYGPFYLLAIILLYSIIIRLIIDAFRGEPKNVPSARYI